MTCSTPWPSAGAFAPTCRGCCSLGIRNKTLTCLIGTEPIVGAQAAPVQQLQFFLSQSTWDVEAVSERRLELAIADPATSPHEKGVLVIDDTGDRKDGTKTDHVARQ